MMGVASLARSLSPLTHGPTIHGESLILRPVVEADLSFLQHLWNDGRVMQYVGFPNGLAITPEKLAQWWSNCRAWTATHLIVETPDGARLGETGWGFCDQPGMLELKLLPSCWGQGIGKTVFATLLQALFEHTTIDTFVVSPHPKNVAARRLYQRFGFAPESPPAGLSTGDHDYWTLVRPEPPAPPTTLVFDWGGVLMRTLDDSGRRAWDERLSLAPGTVDRMVFDSDAWREAQLGTLPVAACWQAIGRSLGLDAEALTRFRHDFWAGDRLDRELIAQLRRWKAAGHRVALLSNFTPELNELLDAYQLRDLFDPIIISADEALLKPAAWLYWRILNRLGISPAEALFVDDSGANIAGARSVGLYGIQYQNSEQAIGLINGYLA